MHIKENVRWGVDRRKGKSQIEQIKKTGYICSITTFQVDCIHLPHTYLLTHIPTHTYVHKCMYMWMKRKNQFVESFLFLPLART